MKNILKALPYIALAILLVMNVNQSNELTNIRGQLNSTAMQFRRLDDSLDDLSIRVKSLDEKDKRIKAYSFEDTPINIDEDTASVDIVLKLNGVDSNSQVKVLVTGRSGYNVSENEMVTIDSAGNVSHDYEMEELDSVVLEEFEVLLTKEQDGVYSGNFVGHYNRMYETSVIINSAGTIYQERLRDQYLYDQSRVHIYSDMWTPIIRNGNMDLTMDIEMLDERNRTRIKEYIFSIIEGDQVILSYDVLESEKLESLDENPNHYSLDQSIPFEPNKSYTVKLVLVDEYNRSEEQSWIINTLE